MALGLKMTIEGDKELTKAISSLDFKAKNPRAFYMQFGAYMRRIPARSVQEQKDPVTGKAWPKRSSISLQSRRGKGGNTLADTGALVRSFNAGPLKVTADGVAIGSALKYARILQIGGIIRAKKKFLTIPLEAAARKFANIKAWFAAEESRGRDPFFFRSKTGKVFAAYMKGKSAGRKSGVEKGRGARAGKMAFAWLLTPSVKIPARRYLGFGKRDKEHFVELARKFFSVKSSGKGN